MCRLPGFCSGSASSGLCDLEPGLWSRASVSSSINRLRATQSQAHRTSVALSTVPGGLWTLCFTGSPAGVFRLGQSLERFLSPGVLLLMGEPAPHLHSSWGCLPGQHRRCVLGGQWGQPGRVGRVMAIIKVAPLGHTLRTKQAAPRDRSLLPKAHGRRWQDLRPQSSGLSVSWTEESVTRGFMTGRSRDTVGSVQLQPGLAGALQSDSSNAQRPSLPGILPRRGTWNGGAEWRPGRGPRPWTGTQGLDRARSPSPISCTPG